MDSHDYLEDLIHFSYVVNSGGYTAASMRYGIPKSRLSRRVKRLENRFGCALLNRSSSQFIVTPIGLQIYERCRAIIAEAEHALTLAHSAVKKLQGELRICCPVVITQIMIGRLAAKFSRDNPHVRIILEASNRIVDPVTDGFDLVIRPTPKRLKDSGLIARVIGTGRFIIVSSPTMNVDEYDGNPAMLDHLPMVGYGTTPATQRLTLTGPGGLKKTVQYEPTFVSDNLMALKEAALAGVGVAALPDSICQDELKLGLLIDCCPNWQPPPMTFYALYQSRAGLTLAARAFLSFLSKELKKELSPIGK